MDRGTSHGRTHQYRPHYTAHAAARDSSIHAAARGESHPSLSNHSRASKDRPGDLSPRLRPDDSPAHSRMMLEPPPNAAAAQPGEPSGACEGAHAAPALVSARLLAAAPRAI